MKRFLLFINIIAYVFSSSPDALAKGAQIVSNEVVSAVIVTSSVTGNIFACAGTASVSPNIQQFTVSGTGLTGNITTAAPAGFEVSLAFGRGYGPSVLLSPSGGAVNSTIVYVRAAASALPGKISGNVVLTSAGAANQSVAVSGIVNSLPLLNLVSNQTFTNGTTTTGVTFTGTSGNVTWVNNTPGIGLAASGTGNIGPFTAMNNGSSNVVATITATPASLAYAYIANSISNNVSVINTATNTVVSTIAVGQNPTGVSVSPDGTRVYITNQRSNSISVISTASNIVLSTITIAGFSPTSVSVSPDGLRIYVVNLNSNNVSVISTVTNALIATIGVGGYPVGIAVTPDGSTVYVANSSNNVSVIDAATNTVKTTIPADKSPYGIAVSPDGTRVYVAISGAGSVSVIDVGTNTLISTIPVGSNPAGVAVSPDGGLVYVSNQLSKTISVISTLNNTVVATIPVGSYPEGVSLSADGGTLYVANEGSNTVSIVNTATNTLTATVDVGAYPISTGNFVTSGTGCSGVPVNFTITVTPTTGPASITVGEVTGNIFACAGMASAGTAIEQFIVSGNNLTGDITATAPSGFEVSLMAGSGYGNSVTLIQTEGTIESTPVYIRSSSSAASGTITGSVMLTSPGATTQNVAVTATVNPLPLINPVPNQTFTNGTVTPIIDITGTGNMVNWTNDTPGIGLAASGIYDIPSFIATNNGKSPIIATITAIPLSAGLAFITNGDNTISVISTLTHNVASKITVGTSPGGIAVSGNGRHVYVMNNGSDDVSVINTSTNTVVATIAVGKQPISASISPDGLRVYVTNTGSDDVSVIDAVTNQVIATIPVGKQPYGLTISSDGTRLYVVNENDNNISVINTAANAVISTLSTGLFPMGVSISPDGGLLYVTNFNSNNVSVISTVSNTLISSIPVGTGPFGISINPNGSLVYVANEVSNNVSVINTATNTVISTIPVGSQPHGISINPGENEVYVTNSHSNNVSVISMTSNKILYTIPVTLSPVSFGNFVVGGTECIGMPVTFTITVNPTPHIIPGPIVIPNAFTPNGDGINDTWNIKNLPMYQNCTVEIFNRYGENVFSSIGYGVPWNGTYNGAALPTGTYYYIVNLKNGSKVLSGSLAIVR